MTILQALVLGAVQGLTEFLPVSSSAHLLIVPHLLGWNDPGIAFSAAIHLGTLAALLAYFARDVVHLVREAVAGLWERDLRRSPACLMAWSIVPATLPAVAAGLSLRDFFESDARQITVVAGALIALSALLLLAERVGSLDRSIGEIGFWRIQFIGLCQAIALIPGSSRSGCTIMAGLFVGLKRHQAARFSFILGLPAITGAGGLELIGLLRADPGPEEVLNLVVGITAAAVSGFLTIGLLLRFLEHHGTHVFAYYRIALGLFLLFLYTG
ncbi:MAG: undecaprenyl-diphosphatase UppP [Candidatus Latescibacterota bacterium]|nr:undecaprenyl-diphosphatase UppP [Candidatus Latescibacterota bacterium]